MNLTDEGLRGMTRELCLKMEHEHDSIFFNQSDFNYILHALKQVRDAAKKEEREKMTSINERVAQITAHRACCGTEHDPTNGKLHGLCVVCGVPFPCDYVGQPPTAIRQMDGGK